MLKLYVEIKVSACFGSTGVKFISLPDISKISMNFKNYSYMALTFLEMFSSTAYSLTYSNK